MNLFCKYCCEIFDKNDHKPFQLECGHIFCLDCINIIKHFKIPASCPFDNNRLCFDNSIPRNDLIENIQSLCSLHMLEIKGICIIHNVKICNKCNDHKNCKTIIGNLQEIDLKINEIINKVKKINNEDIDFIKNKFNICLSDGIA